MIVHTIPPGWSALPQSPQGPVDAPGMEVLPPAVCPPPGPTGGGSGTPPPPPPPHGPSGGGSGPPPPPPGPGHAGSLIQPTPPQLPHEGSSTESASSLEQSPSGSMKLVGLFSAYAYRLSDWGLVTSPPYGSGLIQRPRREL